MNDQGLEEYCHNQDDAQDRQSRNRDIQKISGKSGLVGQHHTLRSNADPYNAIRI
jgi:hypothetical protein